MLPLIIKYLKLGNGSQPKQNQQAGKYEREGKKEEAMIEIQVV